MLILLKKEIAHILDRENKIKPEREVRISLPSAPNFLLYHIDKRGELGLGSFWQNVFKEPQLS